MSTLPIPATNLVIVSVGIGLWLCAIGAIVGFLAAGFATYSLFKAPVVAEPTVSAATTFGVPPEGKDSAS